MAFVVLPITMPGAKGALHRIVPSSWDKRREKGCSRRSGGLRVGGLRQGWKGSLLARSGVSKLRLAKKFCHW